MDFVDPVLQLQDSINRRTFLKRGSGLGLAALFTMLGGDVFASLDTRQKMQRVGGRSDLPHFAPKAKRVIYLHQSGAPSQMDLFDPKPDLEKFRGQELPDSIRNGQRLTGMTSGQKKFPVAPTIFKFAPHGQSGLVVSELLPHLAEVIDECCFIHSMNTEAINHDPAITFLQTGSQLAGRPSMGAWLSYGLGTQNNAQ